MELRKQLLIRLITTLFIGCCMTLAVALILLLVNRERWTENVVQFIKANEVENIQALAINRSTYVQYSFAQVKADTLLMASSASTAYVSGEWVPRSGGATPDLYYAISGVSGSNDATLKSGTAAPGGFPTTNAPSNGRAGGFFVSSCGTSQPCSGSTVVSTTASQAGQSSNWMSLFAAATVTQAKTTAKILSGMQASQVPNSANYQLVYLGTEDSGVWTVYPLQDLRALKNLEITCNRPGVTRRTGYDPRCRGWYHRGKDLPSGSVSFSEPYVDAVTGKLAITASAPVKTGPSAQLQGVVGNDFLIADLEQILTRTPVMKNGYSFLIDKNGLVIIHPQIDRDADAQNIVDMEFSSSNEKSAFESCCLSNMRQLLSGDATFKKDGKTWYSSWQPDTQVSEYVVVLFVPESDIQATSNTVARRINVAVGVMVSVTIGVIVGCIVLAQVFTGALITRIVKPIKSAVEVTRQMSNNTFKNISELDAVEKSCLEIDMLIDAYKEFATVILFGNTKIKQGHVQEAIGLYDRAMEVFVRTGNVNAQGVCFNNKASAYFIDCNFSQARTLMAKAIDLGIKQWHEASKQEGEAIVSACKMLAARYISMGRILHKLGHVSESMGQFADGLRILNHPSMHAQRTSRFVSLASTLVNLEPAPTIEDLAPVAAEIFTCVDNDNEPPLDPLLHYSAVGAVGILLCSESSTSDNSTRGERWMEHSLRHGSQLTEASASIIASHLYKKKSIHGQDWDWMRSSASIHEERRFHFVLDNSGSMGGSRINHTVDAMQNIFSQFVQDSDQISFTTFSSKVETQIPLSKVSDVRSQLESKFSTSLRRVYGTTALYDAVIHAANLVNKDDHTDIVLLFTDGDDTSSRRRQSEAANATVGLAAGFYVITVGSLNAEPFLKKITANAKFGGMFKANDTSAIADTFVQVAEDLSNRLELQEY